MRIVATPLTSGNVAPDLESLSGGYHFQRDPTWTPNDPRYRQETPPVQRTGGTVRATQREERLREFSRLREEEGLSVAAAGRALGIAEKTARTYERDRLPFHGESGS